MELSRDRYNALFGPTVGDRIRLADTNLLIEVTEDHCVGGDEVVFGGGKVIRESMGQSRVTRARLALDGRPSAEVAVTVAPHASVDVEFPGAATHAAATTASVGGNRMYSARAVPPVHRTHTMQMQSAQADALGHLARRCTGRAINPRSARRG